MMSIKDKQRKQMPHSIDAYTHTLKYIYYAHI